MGTGFTDGEIDRLLRKLRPLERRQPTLDPVPKMPKIRKGAIVWVEPELVAEVEFVEWTHDGRLGHGLQGAAGGQVHDRGATGGAEPMERRSGKASAPSLSNLDKPFWPDEGITKATCSYYRLVADSVVPHPS